MRIMKQLSVISIATLLLLFACITGSSELSAQGSESIESRQNKKLKKTDLAYKDLNRPYSEKDMQAFSSKDKAALTRLADSFWQAGQYDRALDVYKHLYPTPSVDATKQLQLRIAELYSRFRDYGHASEWLSGVEGYKAKADVFNNIAELELMKKDSLNWHVGSLNTNTTYQEFSPCITDTLFYFCSNRPDGLKRKSKEEFGLNYARLWQVPMKRLNTSGGIGQPMQKTNEAAALVGGFKEIRYNTAPVSIDKNSHFYFSTNYLKPDKSGVYRLCLNEAFYDRNGVLKSSVIPFGNPNYTVMHPAINADGTLLVISSNKPDGVGGYDLYYAQRAAIDQSWGELKSLNINTVGDEVFPTITSNGYLYYSSDARPGLGGLDIYRILLNDAMSGAGTPEHLSYPINSSSDDFGWAQDTTTVNGYFASDRLGNNNIYSFNYREPVVIKEVPKIVTPEPVADSAPSIDANYLYTVLFSSNKYHINKSNKYLLDALIRVMVKYPCLNLQIKSFTDMVGESEYNQKLSSDRAVYLRNYLISKGISAARLDTLCFGEAHQINQNKTEVEKALNRRVLFQAAPTGCNKNVDDLLTDELVSHDNIYSQRIFVLKRKGKFIVQVGAFKIAANALALEAKLKRILPENVFLSKEGNFHQVRVGGSTTLVEAEKIAAIIDAIGVLD